MVKAEVKTPNKRKSIANNTPKIKVEKDSPAKKFKVENDSPAKKIKSENGQTPVVKREIAPSPKNNNKKNQQGKPTNGAGPKPFKGTQQLNKKPGKGKPAQGAAVETKKRRKNQFANLMAEVKAKSGTKDADVLAKLNQRIKEIKARGELTKTAKKKLSILSKMKLILEEGGDVAAAKSKIQRQKDIEEARKAREAKKGLKKPDGALVTEAKKGQAKQQQGKKVVQEEDSDEEEEDDDDDEEDSDELDDEEDDDDDESDEEETPAPKVSIKKTPNKKK